MRKRYMTVLIAGSRWMPRSASRWSWAKVTIACCEALVLKRTSTSSGTKFRFAAATLAGVPPPSPPPLPDGGVGGGVLILTGPLGPAGKVGNPTMIGGLCGQRGGWWRGGRSPLPGGRRALRAPSRKVAEFD